jgi:hypothetical protein
MVGKVQSRRLSVKWKDKIKIGFFVCASSGRSVGIVSSRTQATEDFFLSALVVVTIDYSSGRLISPSSGE